MKLKTPIVKVGPDKVRPKRSDECCGEKNKRLSNESKGYSKDMPGGGNRISNGSLPK